MTHAFAATALALVMLGMSGPSRAADTAPPNAAPDAEASDPRALGWMQGTPPAADKQILPVVLGVRRSTANALPEK